MRNLLGGLFDLCFVLLCAALPVGLIVGWIMNIVALFNCDFEESYRAEAIRTVSAVVFPVGCVMGWITIEDKKIIKNVRIVGQ